MNEPMPLKLDVTTWFKVIDSSGRILRSEELPAGAHLPDRLRLAHRNYQLQGWTVDPLRPGRWSFLAEKVGQRLLIGIRRPGTAWGTSQDAMRHPIPPLRAVTAGTTAADRLNQHPHRPRDSG
jgi:hypothetical protein